MSSFLLELFQDFPGFLHHEVSQICHNSPKYCLPCKNEAILWYLRKIGRKLCALTPCSGKWEIIWDHFQKHHTQESRRGCWRPKMASRSGVVTLVLKMLDTWFWCQTQCFLSWEIIWVSEPKLQFHCLTSSLATYSPSSLFLTFSRAEAWSHFPWPKTWG